MSGGVDSSVAACLLLEQGYEVVGSHMRLVHLDGVEHGCCGPAARHDAAEVAADRGVPVRDLRPVRRVRADRDRRLRGRARGRAHPEPVRALQRRDQVRRVPAAGGRARDRRRGDRALRADRIDAAAVSACSAAPTAPRTSRTCCTCSASASCRGRCFPVGGMPKAETRAAAERFGLPVASKPDSQELCFAPSGDGGRVPGVGRAAPDARGRGRRYGRTRAGAARGFGGVHGRAAARSRRLGPRALLRARDRRRRPTG